MQVCFLASSYGTPAVKTFTAKGTLAYPQIKSFTSTSYTFPDTFEGLSAKLDAMIKHASRGACMLKGYVEEPLVNKSRKGSVNREAMTSNMVLDIDGIILPDMDTTPPFNRERMAEMAQQIVDMLPSCFHEVSYIAHASSSMGMKGRRLGFHLDFLLKDPVHPKQLKDFLLHLNFSVDTLNSQLDLAASGNALRYPLDRCVADNSRLLYIGTPTFQDGLHDPIPVPEHRFFLVQKDDAALDLLSVIEDPEYAKDLSTLGRRTTERVNNLRSLRGLSPRKDKISLLNIGGMRHSVVTNPDQLHMHFVEDRGDWITYNINDGDSGAYYVHKLNPSIVYNFKDEPNFLFEQADPDTYAWHVNTFIADKERAAAGAEAIGGVPLLPLVFRDYATNLYFNGLFNPLEGKMQSINRAGRECLGDFLIQHGAVMGEIVQTWEYEFQPWNNVAIDFNRLFINKYSEPALLSQLPDMPKRYTPLRYSTACDLENYCPRIFELIRHVLGNEMASVHHFLNWLAAAVQSKRKNKTAWILQGVQGTGKGQLFDLVIAPLAGTGSNLLYPQAMKLKLENLEEQFNAWVESALFCMVDEFSITDSISSSKLFNKVKNLITEDQTTSRAHFSGARAVTSYTNFIFTANQRDVMFIPNDDRRFNIAPRQEHKLDALWGSKIGEFLFKSIPEEMPRFARLMVDFQVDETQAHTALLNAAKQSMRTITRTSIEEFVDAVKNGDLDYFVPILDLPYGTPGLDYTTPAKSFIVSVIRDYDASVMHKVTMDQLRILFNCSVGRADNPGKFGKMLSHKGLEVKRVRIGNILKYGVEVMWATNNNTIEDLRKTYVTEADMAFVRSPDGEKVVKLKAHVT